MMITSSSIFLFFFFFSKARVPGNWNAVSGSFFAEARRRKTVSWARKILSFNYDISNRVEWLKGVQDVPQSWQPCLRVNCQKMHRSS